MLDRHGLTAATAATSLGMLADDALIAAVRYQKGAGLDERSRVALEVAAQIFQHLRQLSTREVVVRPMLRDMAPVGALDETFLAVTQARSATGEDLAATLQLLHQGTLDILAGSASPEGVQPLREFFNRLGLITLSRTEDLARPQRERRQSLIGDALTFAQHDGGSQGRGPE